MGMRKIQKGRKVLKVLNSGMLLFCLSRQSAWKYTENKLQMSGKSEKSKVLCLRISLSPGASAEFVAVTDRNIRLSFRFTHVSSACMYVCRMYKQVFFRSMITLM